MVICKTTIEYIFTEIIHWLCTMFFISSSQCLPFWKIYPPDKLRQCIVYLQTFNKSTVQIMHLIKIYNFNINIYTQNTSSYSFSNPKESQATRQSHKSVTKYLHFKLLLSIVNRHLSCPFTCHKWLYDYKWR